MSEDVEQMEAMLRLMFGDLYVSMFHVIDDDMIRKPVFQSQKIKSYENGDSVFKVTVNWRLLGKLRKQLCGEEEAPEPIEPTFVDLDERIKEKEEK